MTVANQLQHLIDRVVAKRPVRGVLAAIRSGSGTVDAAAVGGFADASLTVPLTIETPYFLASITKMYTAVVVMQLARDGIVDLGAPIGDYLPAAVTSGIHLIDGTDRGPTITLEQLLFQTSGLADYFAGNRKGEPSLEQALNAGTGLSPSTILLHWCAHSRRGSYPAHEGDGRRTTVTPTTHCWVRLSRP